MNLIFYIPILLSCIFSYAATLITLRFAHKHNIFDYHNSRKIHNGNVPRLGGVAILIATIMSLFTIFGCSFLFDYSLFNNYFATHYQLIIFSFFALIIISITGLFDDLKGFRYRTKFVAQIAAGLIMCYSGYWINNFHGLFGLYELNAFQGWLMTIFTVLLISNAINFIDGIDGLAGSLCLFYFTFYLVVGVYCKQMANILISSTIIGALVPFLYFNIFGKIEKKTKIFLGDTGALLMGFIISVICVDIANSKSLIFNTSPLALAYCPLVVPCFDLARVVLNRLFENRNPFKADKTHIHHLIVSIVHSQGITLLYIIILTVLITALSIVLTLFYNINLVFLFLLIFWAVLMMVIYRKLRKTNKIKDK